MTTKELLALAGRVGELILTQDNRITDAPIFIVQQKRRICGLDDGYADGHEWRYDGAESSYDDEAKAERDAEREADGSEPLEWEQVGYIDKWDFVTACFTEQGCKDHIAVNGHNLNQPRIYAEGSFRNAEWRAVRDHLSTLPALCTEVEALRKDAERYRWLRNCDYDQDRAVHTSDGSELKSGDDLDAAIDAAKEPK